MKRQNPDVFLAAVACAILCGVFLSAQNIKHEKRYSVLDVNSKSQFCLDLNSDLKCSAEEYFRLKDITMYFEGEYELSRASNDFLKELILNKSVVLKERAPLFIRHAKIYLDGDDVSKLILSAGLALPHKTAPSNYVRQEDLKKFQANREKYKTAHKALSLPRKNEIIEPKTPNITTGALEGYFINPNRYTLPSNKARTHIAQALLYEINSAKYTIDAAIYGMEEQKDIYLALLNAKNRGVRVRIVTDSNPNGTDAYLDGKKLRADFNAVSDNSPHIMHNKFFVFDSQKVVTMTLNLSPTGSGGYNSNTAIAINSKSVADVYLKEFEQMFSGKFHHSKAKNDLIDLKLNDDTVLSVYFSPASNILTPILNQIKSAKKEILVSAFYLTHMELINELIASHNRGVDVIAVIDALGAGKYKARIDMLRNAGIKVKVENWGGKNHQKNILIDSKVFITGSANFSKNAVTNNDENLLIIENTTLARAYRGYWFSLYNSIGDEYLFKYPHAEGLKSGYSCADGIDNDFDGKIDNADEGCKAYKK